MEPPAPSSRLRTCRACGNKFEYPVKGAEATRHHCPDCAAVLIETRRVLERLSARIARLEHTVRRLQEEAAKNSGPTAS